MIKIVVIVKYILHNKQYKNLYIYKYMSDDISMLCIENNCEIKALYNINNNIR